MSTDRELLELAAKAAGYDVRWHEVWDCYVHVGPHNIDNPPTLAGQRMVWSPLTDDGDALRLAVKLRLDINAFPGDAEVSLCPGTLSDPFGQTLASEYGDDAAAAARRVIVRAAAEIGRQS